MTAACSVARIPYQLVVGAAQKGTINLFSYSEIEFEFELLKLSCPPALAVDVSAWGGCRQVS